MRESLSFQYITGSGIEIGGLHYPLSVNPGVDVTYVDLMPSDSLQKSFPEVEVKKNPIVIDSAETLATFKNESQDFVIANHVFEHCENPIGTWRNWVRVLKSNGIIYAAIPDKRFTFDKKRAITSFEHLIADDEIGPDGSLRSHYEDWFRNSELEGRPEPEVQKRVEEALKTRNNIHFHVWDFDAIVHMFSQIHAHVPGYKMLQIIENGWEVIVIARKY